MGDFLWIKKLNSLNFSRAWSFRAIGDFKFHLVAYFQFIKLRVLQFFGMKE